MHAVLTLFRDSKNFHPITRRRPVGMLPFLNRPILEWHIMNCVRSGIRSIHIIAVENPLIVGEFVGPDTRWGASIELIVYKDPCDLKELLTRIAGMVLDEVLVIPVETVIDLPYKEFENFHNNAEGKITRVLVDGCVELNSGGETWSCSRKLELEPVDTGVYITDPGGVNSMDVVDYIWGGNFLPIETPEGLWTANMAGLGGCFPDFLGPDYQASLTNKIIVGHHTYIDSTAILRAPCLIGDYCRVNPGARILRFSVIGDGVIVDQGAAIESSLICGDTYVGTDTDVHKCIVVGNVMINLDVGSWTSVEDAFLLSGVKKKIVYSFSEKFVDRFLALILLILMAPIWVAKGVSRLARHKPFFAVRRMMLRDLYFDPASKDAARAGNFHWFDDSGPLLQRIPGLIDVISGKLRLVGVRPLKAEEFERYQEDWAQQRFEALDGLFTPVDAECADNVQEEEKIAAENYYIATRGPKEDLKILIKSIKNLFAGR
jgi:NDP-sugar pyrophosphorylase family protein